MKPFLISLLILISGTIVGFYLNQFNHGELVAVGNNEVYIIEGASKEMALEVGEVFTELGFFENDGRKASVRLSKEGGAYSIAYVLLQDAWKDEENIEAFKEVTRAVIEKTELTYPLQIKFCNNMFEVKRSESLKYETKFGNVLLYGDDKIFYINDATKQEAGILGESLEKVGFLDNGYRTTAVRLDIHNGAYTVDYILKDGAWENKETVNNFKGVTRIAVATGALQFPVTMNLCDRSLEVKKTEVVRYETRFGNLLKLGEDELLYVNEATKEEANRLANILMEIGYLKDNGNPASVRLDKIDQQYTIEYVVKEGVWNNEEDMNKFIAFTRHAAHVLKSKHPVKISFTNTLFERQKTVSLD